MPEGVLHPLAMTDPREWKRTMLAAANAGPTTVDATGITHVLRYHDIERLLHEPRLRGVGLRLFDIMGITEGPLRDWYGRLMFTNDGPPHDRLRRLVSKAFTPRSVEQLRPTAAARIEERLSRVHRDGGGDLATLLGDVPMQVMCALVGVPAGDVPSFIQWVDAISPVFGFMEPEQITAATAAVTALRTYVGALVERRSHAPAADLITALLAAEHDGDRLTREETVTMVANLLVGGHDTTASQIGCTLLTLLERPATLAELRSAPALLHDVVNESIRFEPSITAAPRTVVEATEICDHEHAAGTVVMCNFLTANRDPAAWENPDAFLARRFTDPNSPRLLSFGGGPHFCLGAALARVTLEETVRGVANLSPKLTAAADDIAWVQRLGRSPAEVPVTL